MMYLYISNNYENLGSFKHIYIRARVVATFEKKSCHILISSILIMLILCITVGKVTVMVIAKAIT